MKDVLLVESVKLKGFPEEVRVLYAPGGQDIQELIESCNDSIGLSAMRGKNRQIIPGDISGVRIWFFKEREGVPHPFEGCFGFGAHNSHVFIGDEVGPIVRKLEEYDRALEEKGEEPSEMDYPDEDWLFCNGELVEVIYENDEWEDFQPLYFSMGEILRNQRNILQESFKDTLSFSPVCVKNSAITFSALFINKMDVENIEKGIHGAKFLEKALPDEYGDPGNVFVPNSGGMVCWKFDMAMKDIDAIQACQKEGRPLPEGLQGMEFLAEIERQNFYGQDAWEISQKIDELIQPGENVPQKSFTVGKFLLQGVNCSSLEDKSVSLLFYPEAYNFPMIKELSGKTLPASIFLKAKECPVEEAQMEEAETQEFAP